MYPRGGTQVQRRGEPHYRIAIAHGPISERQKTHACSPPEEADNRSRRVLTRFDFGFQTYRLARRVRAYHHLRNLGPVLLQ